MSEARAEMMRKEAEETYGFFYGANDEDKPLQIEDITAMEERLQRIAVQRGCKKQTEVHWLF